MAKPRDDETLAILRADVMSCADGDERLLHLDTVRDLLRAEREACARWVESYANGQVGAEDTWLADIQRDMTIFLANATACLNEAERLLMTPATWSDKWHAEVDAWKKKKARVINCQGE
jgi:hypothetical protein